MVCQSLDSHTQTALAGVRVIWPHNREFNRIKHWQRQASSRSMHSDEDDDDEYKVDCAACFRVFFQCPSAAANQPSTDSQRVNSQSSDVHAVGCCLCIITVFTTRMSTFRWLTDWLACVFVWQSDGGNCCAYFCTPARSCSLSVLYPTVCVCAQTGAALIHLLTLCTLMCPFCGISCDRHLFVASSVCILLKSAQPADSSANEHVRMCASE